MKIKTNVGRQTEGAALRNMLWAWLHYLPARSRHLIILCLFQLVINLTFLCGVR